MTERVNRKRAAPCRAQGAGAGSRFRSGWAWPALAVALFLWTDAFAQDIVVRTHRGSEVRGTLLALDAESVVLDPEGNVDRLVLRLAEVDQVVLSEDGRVLYPLASGIPVTPRRNLWGAARIRPGKPYVELSGSWGWRRPVSITKLNYPVGDGTSVPIEFALSEGGGPEGSVAALFPVAGGALRIGLAAEVARAEADFRIEVPGVEPSSLDGNLTRADLSLIASFPVTRGGQVLLDVALGAGLWKLAGSSRTASETGGTEISSYEEKHIAYFAEVQPELLVVRNVGLFASLRLTNTEISDLAVLDENEDLLYIDIPRFTATEVRVGGRIHLPID